VASGGDDTLFGHEQWCSSTDSDRSRGRAGRGIAFGLEFRSGPSESSTGGFVGRDAAFAEP